MGETTDRDAIWADFLEVWDDLRAACSAPGTVVVVEGERDRRSLLALRLPGRIALVNRGRPLGEVAQRLADGARTIVILTDWDRAGGRLAQRLRQHLEALPLDLDLDRRRELAHALRGEVAHVEGLAGWARRSADRAGTTLEAAITDAELGRRRRRPTG